MSAIDLVVAGCAPGHRLATLPVAALERFPFGLVTPTEVAVDHGAVWVTTAQSLVYRIDPLTNAVVTTVPIIDSAGIAAGADAVWVSAPGRLVRIDPATNAVSATVPVGRQPGHVAVGAGAVWVSNYGDGTVTRVDPHTNRAVASIPVGEGPEALAAADAAVWVASRDGSVTRIDPVTNERVATIAIGKWPAGIAVSHGLVWVARRPRVAWPGRRGEILRIDPATNRVVGDPIPVGTSPWDVKGGEGFLWVTDPNDAIVVRIDPATARAGAIATSGCPWGVAVGDGTVWVSHNPSVAGGDYCRAAVTRFAAGGL